MRVIVIDSNRQEVREAEVSSNAADLRELVGGWLTIAPVQWPGEHVLFVDDEGLFKPQKWFFRLAGNERPFAGNGVLVGPEKYNDEGDYIGTEDVAFTAAQIARVVTFVSRAQADAWAKATAHEAESTLTAGGVTTVLATRGQVWNNMPKPEEEEST